MIYQSLCVISFLLRVSTIQNFPNIFIIEICRGFVPVHNSTEVPPPEWLAWLRGLRKLPPTKEEIAAIRQASIEMAAKVEKLENEESKQHSFVEMEMPHVQSTTMCSDFDSEPQSFPRYSDYDKEQPKMT